MVCQYVALMFWLKMRKDLLSFRNVWLRVPLILSQDSLKFKFPDVIKLQDAVN
jgi:hypothetical protein